MIRFYYWPNSAIVMRTLWALEELELPYERFRMHPGMQHSAEYLTVNPNGLLPAVVDGSTIMYESLAILLYLGEKYGRPKLWPEFTASNFTDALTWIVWGTTSLHPPLLEFARNQPTFHFAYPEDIRSDKNLKTAEATSHRYLKVLEAHLTGKSFTLGEQFSLCDVANAPFIARAKVAQFDLSAYPNVLAWFGRCTSRPSFQRVMAINGAAIKDEAPKAGTPQATPPGRAAWDATQESKEAKMWSTALEEK